MTWLRRIAALGMSYGYGYGYGGPWARDYPKADRQFLLALRRLTLVQTRSTEQIVDLDSDEIARVLPRDAGPSISSRSIPS